MFKRREAKPPKKKRLWGKDFNLVEDGLEEKQVVGFVNDLVKQYEASSPASVSAVLKTAVKDARQIVDDIKTRAEVEAGEESARIIAQAEQEAREVKERSVTGAGKEAEDILPVVNEVVAEAAKESSLPEETIPQAEESDQPQEMTGEGEVEESGAPEPSQATMEELVMSQLSEERPDRREDESDRPIQESSSLYTGEVELTIDKPVDPKIIAGLYNYLQTTPEIKFVRTTGSWDRGTTITVALDKPIPLISVISDKVPEAKVTPERLERDGYVRGRRGVRGIRLSRKKG